MAEIITDPTFFFNSFQGLSSDDQFDSYYAPKNGQRANELNIGRAPKRAKKELNILRDYMSILFNRPVREWDATIAYQYGELVSVKTENSATEIFYTYYRNLLNDNLGVNPQSDTNLDGSYWVEVEPMGTFFDTFNNDIAWMNDVRTGANAHNSGYFIVGERFGKNIAIDRDEIMARAYNTDTGVTEYTDLHLQSDGGNIYIHRNIQDINGNTGILLSSDGQIGIGTYEIAADLHIVGTETILQDPANELYTLNTKLDGLGFNIKSNGKNLSIKSDYELTLNDANGGDIFIGGTNPNNSARIEMYGTTSIRSNSTSEGTVLTVANNSGTDLLSLTSSGIQAINNGSKDTLTLQKDGGAICIHGNNKPSAISITDSGSLVIGKALCNGDTMFNSNHKFEVYGEIYLSEGIKGLKDLQLGDMDGGTYLLLDRRPGDSKYHLNAFDHIDTRNPDTLYIQDDGLDTIFNNGDTCGGNPSNYVHITDCGNVGIGMLNPTCRLQIDGDVCVSSTVNANYNLKVGGDLYIDSKTVSTMTDNQTLYIQSSVSGDGKEGHTVFGARVTNDDQTVRISDAGKMSLGSAVTDWDSLTDRLRVVGNSVFVHRDPATNGELYTYGMAISPSSTGRVDIDLQGGDTASLNINCDDVVNHTFINGGTIDGGVHSNAGKLIVGALEDLEDDAGVNNMANTSGKFKAQISGPTVMTHNLTTTNGDTQKNFMTDTEILRVRRTAEEYVRYGGDYIQSVKGLDNDDDINGASRDAALRIQPYNGKVLIGSTTTATTKVTLETRGIIRATTFDGTATQALYADLAERYQSDVEYPMGTVLCHGGSAEVTAGSTNAPIAGVVSDFPAYGMNNDLAFRLETLNCEKITNTSLDLETVEEATYIANKVKEFSDEGLGRKFKLKIEDVNGTTYTVNVTGVNVRTITFDTAVSADFNKVTKGFDWPMIALKGRLPVRINGTATKGQIIIVDSDGKGRAVDFADYPSNPLLVIGVAINNSYTVTEDVIIDDIQTTVTTTYVEVKV